MTRPNPCAGGGEVVGAAGSFRCDPRSDAFGDCRPSRMKGRLQRLEAGPLPCTKSVLQSHSAEAATANNFCSMNV